MNDIWTQEEEAKRLHARFDAYKAVYGLGQAQFARTYKVPGGASMVSQHIKGRRPLSLEAAGAYATGFGVELVDISPRLAKEVMQATATRRSTEMFSQNHEGKLPLISWRQAGRFYDSGAMYSSEAKDWFICPVPHSNHSYCLLVEGDGMDDGSPDGYREGDLLFVDTQVPADFGQDVIVKSSQNKMVLRRLKNDSEGNYLLTLNGKKIERIPNDFLFGGVVIFSGRQRPHHQRQKNFPHKIDSND
jgi:SOS-response transcriptional repressor LexA